MNASQRAWRWLVTLTAGVTGGSVSIAAWWATLPVELRAALASALVGLCGELWQVVKAALRLRASKLLGVPATPAEAPALGVPDALEREAIERRAPAPSEVAASSAEPIERGGHDGVR